MTQKAVAASLLVVGLGASFPLAAILHNQTSLPVVLPGLAEVPPCEDVPVVFRTEAELALAQSNLQHLLKMRDWSEDAVFFSVADEADSGQPAGADETPPDGAQFAPLDPEAGADGSGEAPGAETADDAGEVATEPPAATAGDAARKGGGKGKK